ncbi:16S rRNA (adenine(1518)-N(6)/adenine(1519)-N(6))-dimethyltransferase RsmA [Buchnera aphidicola (Aphis nasturtii)]|uniref:16S rRNA (adenine(1518)-N(6)/adenine(1519)-N(6))- dimethyltransferase RsmA n=1 Tax=Buchnera aphidicola TaxID=9 RepID=UPI0010C598F0|nr:16S rRNA (adenine(1518)-N(6)/adenine(1519)-N(6))-dimethyltransferase RsmA [Buchnera aphidicola]QCI18131.1 16S rRNA (adenine(1518)-N(6)/adenine(1519)-N(6))-dimethyltransferase RsmA [Buchnera aphidicola (Aphis nasturtii)]
MKKHIPMKKFSQNFLIDFNVIKEIVKFINPKSHQTLVEIGPGLAALTQPICNLIDELIVIEIDKFLLERLKKYAFYSKLIVFYQDALVFDYSKLLNKRNKLIRIFGNLPYHISTSLILCLFERINIIKDMNFMLQKEVAERLVASPGSKLYGRLSIIAQYYCNIKILLDVSPKCFKPVPKVKSTFLSLTPYTNYFPYFTYNIKVLSYITNLAFQKRRKILRHSLGKIFSEKVLIKLNINPKLRPENISILQYCQLSNYMIENNIYQKYISI